MQNLKRSSNNSTSQDKMSVHPNAGQGLVALLVMIAVLCFIVIYYCWGACCRAFCPRRSDTDPESQFSESAFGMGHPTIILLPYGRMVVVDSRMISQIGNAGSALDLRDLGRELSDDDLHRGTSITPDSDTKERGSPMYSNPPPSYDALFGVQGQDMPPSYSDILRRNLAESESDECEDLRESSV